MQTNTLLAQQAGTQVLTVQHNQFLQDVIEGLTAKPKRLDSKYFYDANGDKLFQQIMQCPEYYPTRCEMEILQQQRSAIVHTISTLLPSYDVVELGAGDATKSIHLLQEMVQADSRFTYYPVDISGNIISELEHRLPLEVPGLQVKGLHGEYMRMLHQASELSEKNKLVLFMGANIGNFDARQALNFCRQLKRQLHKGDLLMIGFDLKKHPAVVLDAYNDSQGITRAFNLNLLHRINRELDADFKLRLFDHYASYDPATGACKSYLVSLANQKVRIGSAAAIEFERDECIYMEVSQKYTPAEIQQLAFAAGFTPVADFRDTKNWFADCLWKV